jgi:hypothetical protein
LDDIDPNFGVERAEQLMREYAYVAIQLDSLCYELEFYQPPATSVNGTVESNATEIELLVEGWSLGDG